MKRLYTLARKTKEQWQADTTLEGWRLYMGEIVIQSSSDRRILALVEEMGLSKTGQGEYIDPLGNHYAIL